ncbi:type II toxin-antitoxin system CcdA family antitoxin [Roseofilum casamattae]|uniref:Type II toxin-antitoxin system CcdA family antitoxin n=1 Tax=Roseofilum casamattae BLCC-M143 TaxID=3022442 RepID=A0ABT7C0Z6_9CYAN|nr:type II toxin-antitoxin system CcdA family antitoxin [Roseofilum casamattae]MDJ1185130.1 type II toxin-antitoxin system CcdA family antitoxin [Roseofilum casamattae BLCC-M143]
MNDRTISSERKLEKVQISISLDPDLVEQIQHLTNDPSKIVETAIRQWLKGTDRRDDELTRTPIKNPPLPPRGEWND